MDTLPYTALTDQLGGAISVPLFVHDAATKTITWYVPAWVPPARVAQMHIDAAHLWPEQTLQVVRLTDVPQDALFGDWSEAAPKEGAMEIPWEDEDWSAKARAFVSALEALCRAHAVQISVSGYDGLQIWDGDPQEPPLHVNGIEDRTVPAENVE